MLHCERFDPATLKKKKNLCTLTVSHAQLCTVNNVKAQEATYKNKDIIYIRQKKFSQPCTAFTSVRYTQKCNSRKNSMEKDLMQISISSFPQFHEGSSEGTV